MKEIEVIIGIILATTGSILFELNWGTIIKLFGLILMSAGVIFYIKAVDSLDETKKKSD